VQRMATAGQACLVNASYLARIRQATSVGNLICSPSEDPLQGLGNAGWQRDLALGYGRVATIEAQQGALDLALDALSSTFRNSGCEA
jgi:hypothetical protein